MKYKGRELAHPVVIVRRLLCLVVVFPLMCVLWLVILLGYGIDSANDCWDNLP